MKKFPVLITALSLTLFITSLSCAVFAAEGEIAGNEPGFTIERFVIAGSVEDKEPVGVVNAFASTTEKIYCFLEASNITEETTVSFVWYHGDKKMATVRLPLGKGSRWRTYSSKKLGGLKGEWKVELQDADGNVVETVAFSVE